MPQPVPVILITGFLGSGKTTLINTIISHSEKKIALILNEFGDIKLESQFIEKEGIPVAELANGCMCCVASSDVPRVVELVLGKQPDLDYLIIEASGLSDPDPIHDVLQGKRLAGKVHLSKVICIIDSLHFEQTRNEHQIVMSQLADADTVVISKVAEAGSEQVEKLTNLVSQLTLNTQLHIWNDQLDPNVLLDTHHQPDSKSEHHGHEHHDEEHLHEDSKHHHEHKHEVYNEIWHTTSDPITKDHLETIFSALPTNVVRAKGYANVQGQKMLAQYALGKLELIPDQWGQEDPNTAILFLGKELKAETITNLFHQQKTAKQQLT